MLTILVGVIGFAGGVAITAWFLFWNRMRLNIPAPERLEDDFSTTDKFWASLCIGAAEVQHVQDDTARGGMYARLRVDHADGDQLALAQIDDYVYRPMADFSWRPPLTLETRMRFSSADGPGTTGLFLWNNPLGLGAELADVRPLKWIGFYRVSERADLSGIEHSTGLHATVMNGTWLTFLSLFLPFAPKPAIHNRALSAEADWTGWHTYRVEWQREHVRLLVDGAVMVDCATQISGPLGLVLWYDNNEPHMGNNQLDMRYEAFDEPQWLDIDWVTVERG